MAIKYEGNVAKFNIKHRDLLIECGDEFPVIIAIFLYAEALPPRLRKKLHDKKKGFTGIKDAYDYAIKEVLHDPDLGKLVGDKPAQDKPRSGGNFKGQGKRKALGSESEKFGNSAKKPKAEGSRKFGPRQASNSRRATGKQHQTSDKPRVRDAFRVEVPQVS